MATLTPMHAELSLRDMLADPIVQTMMASDRVNNKDVEDLFAALRKSAVEQARRTSPGSYRGQCAADLASNNKS